MYARSDLGGLQCSCRAARARLVLPGRSPASVDSGPALDDLVHPVEPTPHSVLGSITGQSTGGICEPRRRFPVAGVGGHPTGRDM